jgi:hypothetical protein
MNIIALWSWSSVPSFFLVIISLICFLIFLFILFRVKFISSNDVFDLSVIKQIHHFFPLFTLGQDSSQYQNFFSQQPIYHTNALSGPVIAGNGYVHVLQTVISVTQSHTGNINITSFNNSLFITSRISHYQKSWLLILWSNLIGQCSWSPSRRTSRQCLGVGSIFEYCSLSIWPGADYYNILWVFNSDYNSGCQFNLLQDLVYINDLNSGLRFVRHVLLHLMVDVFGSDVTLLVRGEKEYIPCWRLSAGCRSGNLLSCFFRP